MLKRVLLWVLPCIPTTLPTMLFCRISELTILLEENNPIEHGAWEKMVLERVTLMDISNDIKIIGKQNYLKLVLLHQLKLQLHPIFQKLCARRLENL